MTDKEKLKFWTKGRLFEIMNGIGENDAKNIVTDLLSLIDSMQEEPTIPDIVDKHFDEMLGEEPVSEDLDSFAIKYAQDKPYPVTVCQAVKAGAKWQKQKDTEALNENALLYNARLEGIEIGKAEMKQQMMKDAISCTLGWFNGLVLEFTQEQLDSIQALKLGDKIKVIILKDI